MTISLFAQVLQLYGFLIKQRKSFAAKLEAIYNQLFQHMVKLEEEKYDINQAVMAKDAEVWQILYRLHLLSI